MTDSQINDLAHELYGIYSASDSIEEAVALATKTIKEYDSNADLSHIDTEQLETDLANSNKDIADCETALGLGMKGYKWDIKKHYVAPTL